MPAIAAATNGQVRIDGNVLSSAKWSVTSRVDEVDVTTFETNGFGAWIGGGVFDADVMIDGFWDPDENMFADPLQMDVGQVKQNVALFTTGVGGSGWFIDDLLVSEVTIDATVRDAIRYSIRGKATAVTGGIFREPV